jgi:hypothetical protein
MMHPNAPLKHLQHHRPAVRAVMNAHHTRPEAFVPLIDILAARDAGLVRVSAPPGSRWELTALGADLMTDY